LLSFRGVPPGPRKARPDDRFRANYMAHLRAGESHAKTSLRFLHSGSPLRVVRNDYASFSPGCWTVLSLRHSDGQIMAPRLE